MRASHAGCRNAALAVALSGLGLLASACSGFRPGRPARGPVVRRRQPGVRRPAPGDAQVDAGRQDRKWVKEPTTPQAHASGVRLFAFRSRKKELTCEELALGRREADSVPKTLRGSEGKACHRRRSRAPTCSPPRSARSSPPRCARAAARRERRGGSETCRAGARAAPKPADDPSRRRARCRPPPRQTPARRRCDRAPPAAGPAARPASSASGCAAGESPVAARSLRKALDQGDVLRSPARIERTVDAANELRERRHLPLVQPGIAARPVEMRADDRQRAARAAPRRRPADRRRCARPRPPRREGATAAPASTPSRRSRPGRDRRPARLREEWPLVRPELREHDDVGRRGCEVLLEAPRVAMGVPGVEREHREAVRRCVRGDLGRSRLDRSRLRRRQRRPAAAREPQPAMQADRQRHARGQQHRACDGERARPGWRPAQAHEMAGQRRDDVGDRGEAVGDDEEQPQSGGGQHQQRQPSARRGSPAHWGRGAQLSPHPTSRNGHLPKGNHVHNRE